MSSFKSWHLDLDQGTTDKKTASGPSGYDFIQSKDMVLSGSTSRRKDQQSLQKKQEALFAKASAPLKQVGFMCFMMWMMGNSLQIFSIIMTVSGLASPIMAILKSGEVFPPDPERKLDTLTPRLLYCLIWGGQLSFGLHKLNAMGLLPTHASDWVATAAPLTLDRAYPLGL